MSTAAIGLCCSRFGSPLGERSSSLVDSFPIGFGLEILKYAVHRGSLNVGALIQTSPILISQLTQCADLLRHLAGNVHGFRDGVYRSIKPGALITLPSPLRQPPLLINSVYLFLGEVSDSWQEVRAVSQDPGFPSRLAAHIPLPGCRWTMVRQLILIAFLTRFIQLPTVRHKK